MQTTFAIPAYPKPLKVKQADGSWITIQMHGDEHGHYVMTSDGIPLVFNAQLRNYEYADWKNGGVQASGIKATEASDRMLRSRSSSKTRTSLPSWNLSSVPVSSSCSKPLLPAAMLRPRSQRFHRWSPVPAAIRRKKN